MAIKDLFWACPLCQAVGALRTAGRRDRCAQCGASFRRGRGALIVAETVAGARLEQEPAEWLRRLEASVNGGPPILGPERARVRVAAAARPLRGRGELMGWIESFGPFHDGMIALVEHGLTFRGPDLAMDWPLDRITAVQPTSSALQVKARGQPVAAIRFLEGSVRLWEDRLQTAIRALWRRTGRGEISEFQPCIRGR